MPTDSAPWQHSLVTGQLSRMHRARLPIAIALLVPVLFAFPASADARGCKVPPLPVISLKLTRFYADAGGTVIGKELKKRHRQEVKPLVTFLRHIVSSADKSIVSHNASPSKQAKARNAGKCALRWITAWARGGALLGTMKSKQAEYQRKWDMTGIALAYIKVRLLATDAQRRSIEPWLMKLADRSREFFNDRGRKRNNHWYWLGLGLGAVGMAADSERHWDIARGIMMDAASDISADGTLPLELARKGRALHYHAFAAMPLVVLARLALTRGENWFKLRNIALPRLVAITVGGLRNPDVFKYLSGAQQKRPIKPGAGWLPLYNGLFRHALQQPVPRMKNGHRWLGGDIFKLQKALGRAHWQKRP